MNCLEHFYMQFYQHKGVLTEEQNTGDFNPCMKPCMMYGCNMHVRDNNNMKLKDIVLHHRTVQSVYLIYTQPHCILGRAVV